MKGAIWIYNKSKNGVEYRFQVDGIKRGVYTKVIDPVFKDWKEVGSGINYKKSTETLIFSKNFSSDDEIFKWVKSTINFPTVFNSCNARCSVKVLVADESEESNGSDKKPKTTKSGGLRKSKVSKKTLDNSGNE